MNLTWNWAKGTQSKPVFPVPLWHQLAFCLYLWVITPLSLAPTPKGQDHSCSGLVHLPLHRPPPHTEASFKVSLGLFSRPLGSPLTTPAPTNLCLQHHLPSSLIIWPEPLGRWIPNAGLVDWTPSTWVVELAPAVEAGGSSESPWRTGYGINSPIQPQSLTQRCGVEPENVPLYQTPGWSWSHWTRDTRQPWS
jgi:hypothetical protein